MILSHQRETTKRQLSPPDQVFVNVSDSPYQPKNFKFPTKSFGSKNPTKRSFQTAWFESFKWLHYDERRDAAYCHTCLKALQSGILTSSIRFDTSEFDVNDLVTFMQSLDSSRGKLLSEISTLGKLLVMPVTNAVSERSFSALNWVKTYLRSTTGDSRLNHLMMLHVHKDRMSLKIENENVSMFCRLANEVQAGKL